MPVKKLKADPRAKYVARIMDAIDRAIASPHRADCNTNLPASTAAVIVSQYDNCEQYEGWSPSGVRAVVLAYSLHAPMPELRAMAKVAAKEHADIEAWDDHVCREMGHCALADTEEG